MFGVSKLFGKGGATRTVSYDAKPSHPIAEPVRSEPIAPESNSMEQKFREFYIADKPVDLGAIHEFRSDAFPESGPTCWLDRPNALLEVERREKAGEITAEDAEICKQWLFEGYYIAPRLIEPELLDRVWAGYEKGIADGVLKVGPESRGPEDVLPGRNLDPHISVPVIRELQQHPKILKITDLLFGRKTLPFQTIMGHKGSWQGPHSDTIHMTTYPMGYMLANWIAFEDIHPDSGPLEYFPRSHRLVPPLLSAELDIPPLAYKKDPGLYHRRYEPTIRHYIDALRLEPHYFMAKAGDVLFWHAHLLHGGAPRKDLRLSRKALVCHYFADGAFTYHDLSGNASRLHQNGVYSPPTVDGRLAN